MICFITSGPGHNQKDRCSHIETCMILACFLHDNQAAKKSLKTNYRILCQEG